MEVTISQRIAKTARSFMWDSLPPEVVKEGKRSIIDTLACVYAGYDAPACRIMRDWALTTGGIEESMIWGSGLRVPAPNAALTNGTMVRYPDFNDTYSRATVVGNERVSSIHPSEQIPALVAIAERIGASGKDLLLSIIFSYELGARICDSLVTSSLPQKGFNHTTIGYITTPASVGALMKLNEDQIVNAIGIAGTQVTLGIIDAMPKEANTMVKNVAQPITADIGIKACLWAEKGFTGSHRIFEGHKGLVFSVLGKDFDIQGLHKSLTPPLNHYATLEVRRKLFCSDATTQGILGAVATLAQQVKSEKIEKILLRGTTRCIFHTSDPDRLYLLNKETADHSLPFMVAMVLLEGEITPDQFAQNKLNSQEARTLVEKIQMETDPSMDSLISAGEAIITTIDGKTLKCRIDFPKGSPENPLTDEEVVTKFRRFAGKYLDNLAVEEIIEKVYRIEKVEDLSELTTLLNIRHIKLPKD
jgi:2-methylcitrate dehydratase